MSDFGHVKDHSIAFAHQKAAIAPHCSTACQMSTVSGVVEAAVDLGVVRTVDVAPDVDADPVTLMHDNLDSSLINVMLIAVLLRTATTAKLNTTN